MSAPPTAAVVVYPLMKLRTALVQRNAAAVAVVAGAIERKPAMERRFAPNKELLIRCRLGSIRGLDDMRPASFKKATMDPVNVIPPARRESQQQQGVFTLSLPMSTPR